MTIDLLPGRGVRLPAPLPELPFGLGEDAVRRLLAPHTALLRGGVESPFVCGATWTLAFSLPGVGVLLYAGRAGDGRFSDVGVTRDPRDERPACPVGLHGVDVFGWPAHEVVEALRAGGLPVPDPEGGTLHHDTLRLSRNTPNARPLATGRKPRREPPFTFGSVSLGAAPPPPR
ncbi:hypothetical protein [Streptomyces sp. Y1]|uniref:Uncharacterized protein n=1 Tax=Streptomyces sp. Y1 TaxID=3238634 RepID=A0AB39TFF8_9ACTN